MAVIEGKKIFFRASLIVLGGLFLFWVGFYFGKNKINSPEIKENQLESSGVEVRQSGYKFINPLLECEFAGNSAILKSDEIKIKKAIQEEVIEKNPGVSIALYYRDLNNGPWFGMNEQDKYSPASLLKVPLMIAYYKYAEKNPEIFNEKITFSSPTTDFHQEIKPEKHIELGNSYTIEELIEYMIKHSDNEATNLLFANMDQKGFSSVFEDLGISMPDIYNANNSMSVRDYASFFRILYNASYLDRNMSERALSLLSEVDYKGGLSAGIPENTPVSHKFGERESLDSNNQIVRQLHDCGIIYHSKEPFLLCVMTKGNDFENLSRVISQVSNIVYKQIDENNL